MITAHFTRPFARRAAAAVAGHAAFVTTCIVWSSTWSFASPMVSRRNSAIFSYFAFMAGSCTAMTTRKCFIADGLATEVISVHVLAAVNCHSVATTWNSSFNWLSAAHKPEILCFVAGQFLRHMVAEENHIPYRDPAELIAGFPARLRTWMITAWLSPWAWL